MEYFRCVKQVVLLEIYAIATVLRAFVNMRLTIASGSDALPDVSSLSVDGSQ